MKLSKITITPAENGYIVELYRMRNGMGCERLEATHVAELLGELQHIIGNACAAHGEAERIEQDLDRRRRRSEQSRNWPGGCVWYED